MFDTMGVATSDTTWQTNAARHFRSVLSSGDAIAAVVDDPETPSRLLACGVMAFDRRIPGPTSPTGLVGYLSSMSTEPAWRGRGLGRLVLSLLTAEGQRLGLARIDLHATASGKPLYVAAGFTLHAGNPEMHLFIADTATT